MRSSIRTSALTSENAGGAMVMIPTIINDAKTMEAEVIRAEEDVQKAYEDFMKDSNASIQEKTKSEFNKTEQRAKAEEDLNQTTQGPISLRF